MTSNNHTPHKNNHPHTHNHPPGTVSGNNIASLYDLQETLGRGHFATVKAARHVFTGERVAVKVIDKAKLDPTSRKALLQEVLCMKLVQHKNVVKLYEVIDTGGKLFLVLELGKGDLWDLLQSRGGSGSCGGQKRGLPEPLARHYFVQIFQAVSYCHKLHVVHRDLKPENVVYFPPPPPADKNGGSGKNNSSSYGTVKLTDFGFSNKYSPGQKLDTSCGSLAYSAPEILLGDAYDAPAVDIWSLGTLLYTLLTATPPFQEANDSETLTKIMDVKYTFPPWIPDPPKFLISQMLKRNPLDRITIPEMENCDWLSSQLIQNQREQPLVTSHSLTEEEKDEIIEQMIQGGVVSTKQQVLDCISDGGIFNHVASSFYLLAEKMLRNCKKIQLNSVQLLTSSLESLTGIGDDSGGSGSGDCSGSKEVPKMMTRRGSNSRIVVDNNLTVAPSFVEDKFRKMDMKKKKQELVEEEEEEEEEPHPLEEEEVVVVKKPSKKTLFFNWLFKRNSISGGATVNNNNNNRIYKTRSCGELKLFKSKLN